MLSRGSFLPIQNHRNAYLWAEFCLLFIGVPMLRYLHVFSFSPMQMIWGASGLCAILLLRDRNFEFSRFWRVGQWRKQLPWTALRFAAVASVLAVCSLMLIDKTGHSNIQGHSPFVFTLFFYPFLSVYPQGIIYRGFFFHRYQSLFPDRRLLIFASAMVFGYGHIIFDEPATVGLTVAGGLFFARTYSTTGSLIFSGIEHALYGNLIFAIGMWKYFFHSLQQEVRQDSSLDCARSFASNPS